MGSLYQQATIPVADPAVFGPVREAVAASFAPPRVSDFLRACDRERLRIRDFEATLGRGLLGPDTAAGYNRLGASDQGQIRELYLALLEQVAPELRSRYFRIYAYY